MKIKFDKQQYQHDAVQSITDLFKGQSSNVSNFTVSMGNIVGSEVTSLGVRNNLELSALDVLENVQKVQKANFLKLSNDIQDWNFTVEMETGTGKTYVYTRSVFELNKLYGFTKFIIVVPSVAIREGVYKSLQMTETHFKDEYPGQSCHYFKYDSSNLEQVRDFATSTNIEVMIINIDAFRKSFDDPEKETKANLIHRERDTMNGMRPIQFIQETNPIVIINEPQSVDNTATAKKAIESLNPLYKLRFSATHKETYNLVYKLDPVDAYEQDLVKKIEVLSVTSEDDHNDPYLKLVSVSNAGGYKAKVEIDEQKKNGTVKRVVKEINPGSKNNLFTISGERELYKGYILEGINAEPGNESIEFSNGKYLKIGGVIGGLDDEQLKRLQIRESIRTHLDKELSLIHKGIKVLSLFFIDRVENYRLYPEGSQSEKGKYALIFEEEYSELIKLPKYHTLFEEDKYIAKQSASEVHDGYFSKDKKGQYKNSSISKSGELRSNKDDESTFELIMKEKEKLLSFETPLRFIFSHSALKEGWDNPNVFQICTLVESKDPFTKRQKIGRGLRLPVNQDGKRQYDKNLNILTVIANESYHDFAESLQKEMEEETGVKFGFIEEHVFATLTVADEETGEEKEIGYERSAEVYAYLVKESYISKSGEIKDKLKEEITEESFEVPVEFLELQYGITEIIGKAFKKLPIFKKDDRVELQLNKQVLLTDEFNDLWNRIKYKTTYSVSLDSEKLIEKSVDKIKKMDQVSARKIRTEKADIHTERKGVTGEGKGFRVIELEDEKRKMPDILRYLQDYTTLKRKTLIDILVGSGRLDDFKKNPQAFMEAVVKIINKEKQNMIVDGIKYEKIGEHEYFSQTLFEEQELIGYLKNNALEVSGDKSLYNYIQYDSIVEKSFAEDLDKDEDVKLYVKLPSSFIIETPLGNYNPDWAILLDKDGVEKLYFVIETKGTIELDGLRLRESAKIKCGEKHFEALQSEVAYRVSDSYEEFKEKVKY
ncbi:type III restriction-modification system endonuclease [Sporosarcina sp. YIM B06819]|uniref:type III restriction-modification system endonuclease n=1 Tax=Sporosarcina sp. YIM B06819 TaxID=3081769 RepID=UPI00298D230F|nr:DEAD/DEAH box helicase family protein [Sporosarcina sp. YIM B06819]